MSSLAIIRNIGKYHFKDILDLKNITTDIYFLVNSTFILDLPNLMYCLLFNKCLDIYKGHLKLSVKYCIIIEASPICFCKYINTNGKCLQSKSECKVCNLIQYCKMDNTKYKDLRKCFCA